MYSIAVFDPGMTTGLILAQFEYDSPVEILNKVEIPGGLERATDVAAQCGINGIDITVCERFRMTPRVRTQVQVEPLRIEGAVEAWCRPVVWQWPDKMLLAGGHHGSPSRNKTAADNVLRGLGLWTLPSEVSNHPDANDINSAMKHLVAYLRDEGHEPTLEALRGLL